MPPGLPFLGFVCHHRLVLHSAYEFFYGYRSSVPVVTG
jgi:hypothetical protein